MADMSLNRSKCLALLFVNVALAVVSLHAQANLGSISGAVHDSSGAGVLSAPVIARSASTKTETQVLTNAEGMYVFPALQVGEYELSHPDPYARHQCRCRNRARHFGNCGGYN